MRKHFLIYLLLIRCSFADQKNLYRFLRVDSLMEKAIEQKVFPGGVLLVLHKGTVLYHKAFGRHTYDDKSPPVTKETLYDCASITKLFTAILAMQLWEKGLLNLDAPVTWYLPEFNQKNKELVTIKDLLLHQSGMRLMDELPIKNGMSIVTIKKLVFEEPLINDPGAVYLYDCTNMIVLGWIIERITGKTVAELVEESILKPLHMDHTYTHVPQECRAYCAPTGRGYETEVIQEREYIQGNVHDFKAYCLGGFAGNAGLFSTAQDLAQFVSLIYEKGKEIVKNETVELWLQNHSQRANRALGWAIAPDTHKSCGHYFSKNTVGHLGFTGTSLWYDKNTDIAVILLTNRVYPAITNIQIREFRTKVHDEIMLCLEDLKG